MVFTGLAGPECGAGAAGEDGAGTSPLALPGAPSRSASRCAGALCALLCFNTLLTPVLGYRSSCHSVSRTLIKPPTKAL